MERILFGNDRQSIKQNTIISSKHSKYFSPGNSLKAVRKQKKANQSVCVSFLDIICFCVQNTSVMFLCTKYQHRKRTKTKNDSYIFPVNGDKLNRLSRVNEFLTWIQTIDTIDKATIIKKKRLMPWKNSNFFLRNAHDFNCKFKLIA